jgi:hypothetical protein
MLIHITVPVPDSGAARAARIIAVLDRSSLHLFAAQPIDGNIVRHPKQV